MHNLYAPKIVSELPAAVLDIRPPMFMKIEME